MTSIQTQLQISKIQFSLVKMLILDFKKSVSYSWKCLLQIAVTELQLVHFYHWLLLKLNYRHQKFNSPNLKFKFLKSTTYFLPVEMSITDICNYNLSTLLFTIDFDSNSITDIKNLIVTSKMLILDIINWFLTSGNVKKVKSQNEIIDMSA